MSAEPKAEIACPKCKNRSFVADSRGREDGSIRRRRECSMGHRFSTVEFPTDHIEAMEKKLSAIERFFSAFLPKV